MPGNSSCCFRTIFLLLLSSSSVVSLFGFYYSLYEFLAFYPLLLEGVLALLIIPVLFRKIHLKQPAGQYQGGLWGLLCTKHYCSHCRGEICLGLSILKKPLQGWKQQSGQAESFLFLERSELSAAELDVATYSSEVYDIYTGSMLKMMKCLRSYCLNEAACPVVQF